MGFVSSYPVDIKRVSVVIENLSITTDSAGHNSKTYTTAISTEGFFWTGATAEKYVSDKIKPDLAGVIAIDYTTTEITEAARVTVNGNVFTIISPENVAFQDEVFILPVKL